MQHCHEEALATTVDTMDIDWEPLDGSGATDQLSWLRVEGDYPSVICEKLFFDFPESTERLVNVAIHRWGVYNDWDPQRRHAAVLDTVQLPAEVACADTASPVEGG